MNLAQTGYQIAKMWGWPSMKKVGILALCYSHVEPLLVEAWNLARFKNGLHFVGTDVRDFIKNQRFDVIILQHWTPPELLEELRRLSPGTKFLFWVALEAIQPDEHWSGGHQETFRQMLQANYLLNGTDGERVEIAQPGKPTAAIAVDMLDPSLPMTTAERLEVYRRKFGQDGWFFDSVTPMSYFAGAPNAPDRQNRTLAWGDVLMSTRRLDPKSIIWGNTVGTHSVFRPMLDVCFAEHFFRGKEHVEQLVESLEDRACLCPKDCAEWWERGFYEPIAHRAALAGIRNLYVCTAWTGQHLMAVQWK